MFSSIAINNQHTDKSLPPLLLLPSVVHFETQQDGRVWQTALTSYDYYKLDVSKSSTPLSDKAGGSTGLQRLAFLAAQNSTQDVAQVKNEHAPTSLPSVNSMHIAGGSPSAATPNVVNMNQHYEVSYNTPQSSEGGSGKSVSPLVMEGCTHGLPQEPVQRTSSSPGATNQEPTVIAASKYKRQRTGPSCDICRSKKIKCDATIMILFQDTTVTSSFGNKLHSEVNILELSEEGLSQIPEDIRQALFSKELMLLKHVDKLIAFKPCNSCTKRKSRVCSFSKGFTRADINVFTNLCIKFGKRDSIDQFDLDDYRNCGYQL